MTGRELLPIHSSISTDKSLPDLVVFMQFDFSVGNIYNNKILNFYSPAVDESNIDCIWKSWHHLSQKRWCEIESSIRVSLKSTIIWQCVIWIMVSLHCFWIGLGIKCFISENLVKAYYANYDWKAFLKVSSWGWTKK